MVKRVLMIAYHFPPASGSSGMQRTLSFSRDLPEHDWQPIILSIYPRAYERRCDDQLADIGSETIVYRAFGLDTARHLALGGRYSRFLALPDRWVSWWLGAVPAGLRLIRRYRPQVLWSTYPIATAHLIGLTLHRLSGIPWIADFRDSMTEDNYPSNPRVRRAYRAVEAATVHRCTRAIFTAPGAVRMYAERYPERSDKTWVLIENGYEDSIFDTVSLPSLRDSPRPFRLVHSGVVYPNERDPRAFFEALASLKRSGQITAQSLQVVFRASGSEDYFRQLLREWGIDDIVHFEPHIPYRGALAEMLTADGLLILQASNCNHQIPAKLYEYLRARRPILGLTDSEGDTARVLRQAGIETVAPLDSAAAITATLQDFLKQLQDGTAPVASEAEIARSSRRSRVASLAECLEETIATDLNFER
ncbi:hypothetical protein Noc_1958 [Nitrosococcus oceani ATCC 19707]|uniref:Glycosyltransferase subfamily 4-like N-terminal domain-containing protein n=2 Tax=Nitrosococcus oceani TaxID=1229 RepID=Q3J9S6_NITOC|nr:glycosyltransferase [Nitrosococcus oceani]ABA58420.1 hypothetical protein Noc_1958 [Nitrosococcus oceani ATCC 19707]